MPDMLHKCIVTGGSDATVLKKHVSSDTDPLYKEYKGFHTGVDLKSSKACSPVPGDVLYVGTDGQYHSVILQLNSMICVQLSHMKSVEVEEGQSVVVGQSIGECDKFIHVDLLTDSESLWRVRVKGRTFFKNDPMKLLADGYQSLMNTSYLYDPITSDVKYMLTDNEGGAVS